MAASPSVSSSMATAGTNMAQRRESERASLAQPCAWRPMDLKRVPERWNHTFSKDELAQIDAGLRAFESERATGQDVSAERFPLGSLRGTLLRVRESLEADLGVYML